MQCLSEQIDRYGQVNREGRWGERWRQTDEDGRQHRFKNKKVVGVLHCTARKRKLAFSSWKTFIRPGAGTRLLASKKLLVKHT
jgi:hypothetical protein